jgi:hypothetical protein
MCRLSLLVLLAAQCARATESMPSSLYEVVTETGMPHLEENLRYAVTRETRCLSGADLASAFPVLEHASLADCALQHERREGETISYRLECTGGHGTTGSATWHLTPRVLRGTLQVKLGGKNMTFFQRVTATAVGVTAPSRTHHQTSSQPCK